MEDAEQLFLERLALTFRPGIQVEMQDYGIVEIGTVTEVGAPSRRGVGYRRQKGGAAPQHRPHKPSCA